MKFRWTRIAVFMMAALVIPNAQVGLHASPKPGSELMEIVLEKKTGDTVQAMAAGHVFQTGDILRFRLRPAFDGFLYVTDLGTSGRTSLLFPKQETGSDNRIDHTREYVVPATPDGWFEVSGPPGYETLYFVMSPVASSRRVGAECGPKRRAESEPGNPAGNSAANDASALQ